MSRRLRNMRSGGVVLSSNNHVQLTCQPLRGRHAADVGR